jgi:hypothetical protein
MERYSKASGGALKLQSRKCILSLQSLVIDTQTLLMNDRPWPRSDILTLCYSLELVQNHRIYALYLSIVERGRYGEFFEITVFSLRGKRK